ncbi:hypothetical protein F5Y15DRAFT_424204 [Xylariaceae sp. FL0016]|nr:hypothetical protein F5Y15DRAFT_424204 [Xylariaceae sp. FL0016]
MKILCLDGWESDSLKQIFSSEASARLSFDFAQAPLISTQVTPPDATTARTPDSTRAKEDFTWISKKLQTDGPYDGVIAYSRAAALISSFLLTQQWYSPELPPPFRFAFFIAGSIPLPTLRRLGVPVPAQAQHTVRESQRRARESRPPHPQHVGSARRAVYNSDDCFGLNLNEIPLELKIRIPTVHAWGEGDPLFPGATQLAGLCDPYIRRIHVFEGAHGLPGGEGDVKELRGLVAWCVQRASWPGDGE